MKATVFLIRHGETSYNARGQIQGHTNSRLNKKGTKQARELKNFFATKKIDCVFASPLQRALQTARIAFPNHEIQIEKNFRERRYGEWEGKTWQSLAKTNPKEYKRYKKTRMARVKGMESLSALKKRSQKNFARIVKQNKGQTIAIVGHGMLNKALLASIMQWTPDIMSYKQVSTASVFRLTLGSQKNKKTLKKVR